MNELLTTAEKPKTLECPECGYPNEKLTPSEIGGYYECVACGAWAKRDMWHNPDWNGSFEWVVM